MPLSPQEQIQFEHQPDVINDINAAPLPQLSDVPPSNEFLPPHPDSPDLPPEKQIEEDAAIARSLSEIAELRSSEQTLANDWMRYKEFGEGPYKSAPKNVVADSSKKSGVRPMTRDELHDLQLADLAGRRQRIVDQIADRVANGNGATIIARLEATADQIEGRSAGVADARSASRAIDNRQQDRLNRAQVRLSDRQIDVGGVSTVADSAKAVKPGKNETLPVLSTRMSTTPRKFNLPHTRRRKARERAQAEDFLDRASRPYAERHTTRQGSSEILSGAAPIVGNSPDERRYAVNADGDDMRDRRVTGGATTEGHSKYLTTEAYGIAVHGDTWINGVQHPNSQGGGTTEYLKPFGTTLRELIAEVNKERQKNLDEVDTSLDNASTRLNGWHIDGGPNAFNESYVAGEIQDAGDVIEKLSRRDDARAERMDRAVTTRYRLLQRHITNNSRVQAPHDQYKAYYTDDGGIYMHTSKGGIVLYEDGSSSRDEGTGFVRRYGDGEAWTEPAETVLTPAEDPSARIASFATFDELRTARAEALNNWDQNRDPVSRLQAAEYFQASNARLQDGDTRLTTRIGELQTSVLDAEDELRDLDPTEPANSVRIDELNNQIVRARAEVLTREAQLGTVREELNHGNYWHGVLTVEAVPPVGSPARLGGFALRGTVEDVPPHMQADGSVVRSGATINGIEGDWAVFPDGKTALHEWKPVIPGDPDRLHTTFYNPNGTVDRVVVT